MEPTGSDPRHQESIIIIGSINAGILRSMNEAWSLLANILTPLLVGAMFVVEYAVRLRVLPNWERVGILRGVRAFSRHFGQQAAR